MDRQQLEFYLSEVGNELVVRGFPQPMRVLIVGGGSMILTLGNRASTQDVDVVFLDFPDTTEQPTRETKAFMACAQVVKKRHKLPPKWLNDDASLFVRGYLTDLWAEATYWKTYGLLEAYVLSFKGILVCKLMAYRAKDANDVHALFQRLGIQTIDQAQSFIDQYVDRHWQKEYKLEKTLKTLF